MTDQERLLWSKIRGGKINGNRFRRQFPIGNYVLDFYCPKLKLAVELDGGHHDALEQATRDKEKDDFMSKQGIKILRFWNNELSENLDGVLEKIYEETLTPPQSSPKRGGRKQSRRLSQDTKHPAGDS